MKLNDAKKIIKWAIIQIFLYLVASKQMILDFDNIIFEN
jgi:hypothetical protein